MCRKCLAPPARLEAEFFCRQCKTPFINRFPLDEHGLCRMCRLGASGYQEAFSYGAYEGSLRRLIHLFKFSGYRPLASPLAELLHRALPVDGEYDLIAPMPLHWIRRIRRGFNQSEVLARKLAERRGIPCRQLLKRVRRTRSQTSLTPAQRRRNVAGAFQANISETEGKRVVLVDDVLTTGATASACGAALRKAGASSVTILTVARADRRLLAPARPIEEPEE